MSRIEARSVNDDKLELLRKKLSQTGNLEGLWSVVGRLFQRAPAVLEEMEEQLGEGSKRKQKEVLMELVLEKVREVVEGREAELEGVPLKLSAYNSYVDLLVVARGASRLWSVYLLRDYPATRAESLDINEQGWDLRRRVKAKLKGMKLLPDVQVESRNDRIWLRVAAVKVSKNRARDRVKLERARPSFLVHFPGEPYFYAGAGLREEVGEAVAGVLGCHGWERLPLDGHQVDSLRRMRLGRDARDGPVRARPGKDARFGVAGGVDGAGGAPPQPLVEKGTFRLEGEFKGREALVQPNLLEADVRLGQVMTVSGKDIVTGLLALAAEGVFDSPAPLWLTNFPTAGRNQFVLDPEAGRAVVARTEDWDRFSQISTRSRVEARAGQERGSMVG